MKKSSIEWANEKKIYISQRGSITLDDAQIVVMDPDGWNRQDLTNSYNELIDEAEFNNRLTMSTCLWKSFIEKENEQ